MATIWTERFVVESADDLDDLERTIADDALEAVTIVVPESSTALLGAREFRRVLAIARDHETEVEFQTDDPLRRELARIVGARLSGDVSVDAPSTVVSRDAAPTHRIDALNQREPALVSDESDESEDTFRLWEPGRLAGDWRGPEETDASFSFVITPPRHFDAEDSDVVSDRGSHTSQPEQSISWQTSLPRFEDWERIAPARTTVTQRPSRRRGGLIAVLVTGLTLVVLTAMLGLFVLPVATITVTPIVTPLTAEVTWGIAEPGLALDIAVATEPLERTLTYTATVPTTGERFEPDAAGTGVLQLTNPSTEAIVIPAETVFASDSGAAAISLVEIVIPAADPYSSQMFGSAAVDVRSAVAGPDGDLGSQAVFGQLESGVFFVNRAPIAGGTLKRIATVTQGDLDALNQQARADLISQAPSALEGHVPTGRQIVNGSEQQGTVVVTFDQTAGADAENVKVDARLTVSAQTFDPDAALQQARAEAEQRIAAAAGANARVLPDSLVLTDPQPIDGANNNAFMLRASGSAEAIVDVESLDALRSELTGVNEADALARIQQIAGIEAIAIDREHSWFGNGLPRTDSRISFVITSRATSIGEALPNNAEGVSAEAATPWAASTRP